ncbi:hypothetical protein HNP89_001919 [Methanococcus maripaludis]|uniref:Uncharacterized protein n=1 Tax=Methanococcus maripaludis TaxID=39152 RepID=A0A7J9P337_METMI|nr:hypothetical protein [Methanococcus maripaludis]MBA2853941.1 hypothetical protein [Methanococcus maripaludis]
MVKTKLRKLSSQSIGISISRSDAEYLDIDYDAVRDGKLAQNVEKKYEIVDGKKGIFIYKLEE